MSRKESRERAKRQRERGGTVIKDLADLPAPQPEEQPVVKADYAWEECISEQLKRYGSQEKAEKVCGAIRARYGGKSVIDVPANIRKEIESELGFTADAPQPLAVKAIAPTPAPVTFIDDDVSPLPTETASVATAAPVVFDTPSAQPDYATQLKAAQDKIEQLRDGIRTLGEIIVKQGNRHNMSDWSNVQEIHNKARELGAQCDCESAPAKEITKQTLKERVVAWLKIKRPRPLPAPLTLMKDKNTGRLRFVMVASNNYRDHDRPRQIITEKAHKDFEAWLKENPEYMPDVWLWHHPLALLGKCDGMAYVNNFVVYTGLANKDREYAFYNLAKRKDVGVSHGMHSAEIEPTQQHITRYFDFEVSPLLATRAANKWTSYNMIAKEVNNMAGFDPEKRKFFEEILGKDVTDSIENGTADAKAILDKIVESKEAKVDMPMGEAVSEDESADEEGDEFAELADMVQGLSDKLDALTQAVAALTENAKSADVTMQKLQKSDDEKIAEVLTPKKGAAVKAFTATRDPSTQVKDADALKEPSVTAQWFQKEVLAPLLK